MIAFLPIWHFLEVGLSADHIDMVKMRYKKPFQRALGKKHALKKYDQFALNNSCFWGSNTGSNITQKLSNFTKILLQ